MLTLLDKIMAAAERRFGPRCPVDFQGIHFHADRPMLYHAGDSTLICLGDECQSDTEEATYQLAHEAIHLLCGGRGQATVLEEGAATEFAIGYTLDACGALNRSKGAYSAAASLYQRLQRLDYNAVRKMREEQPRLSLISADALRRHCPRLDLQTAEQLAKRFSE